MNKFLETFKLWLPLGIAVTIMSLVIYTGIQQSYRMSANDPQIQLAEEYARVLSTGKKVDTSKEPNKINIKDSLSPFLMMFDKDQKLIVSTAILNGNSPSLPAGVLDSAKKKGETQITWQPEKKVRSAIVVKYYENGDASGYVVSGRSLREVEKRIQNFDYIVFAGWLGCMILTYFAYFFTNNEANYNLFPGKKGKSKSIAHTYKINNKITKNPLIINKRRSK